MLYFSIPCTCGIVAAVFDSDSNGRNANEGLAMLAPDNTFWRGTPIYLQRCKASPCYVSLDALVRAQRGRMHTKQFRFLQILRNLPDLFILLASR